MRIEKKSIYIDGQYEWNVTVHRTGELIATSSWFTSEQEADNYIRQAEQTK